MKSRRALLLFVASLVVYNANLREISETDTIPTRLLPVSVIREHRLTLNRFFREHDPRTPLPYWAQRVGSDYLSSYPILPALLATPVYLVPVLLSERDSWAMVNALSKLSASLFATLSVVFVYLALRLLAPEPAATGIALVYALGTSTWSVSSQGLWAHGPTQLFVAIAIYCLLRGETEPRLLDGVGVATALIVACRPAAAPAGAVLLAAVFAHGLTRGFRTLALFCGVASPFYLYNLWYFGTVQGGYERINAEQALFHSVAGAWSGSPVGGLLGLLVSPSRGLFVYSPVLAFALAGIGLSFWHPRRHLFALLALAVAGSVLLPSSYSVWWGGYSFGPRYLTDALPLLVMFLVPVWPILDRSRPLAAVFVALFAFSIWAQIVGAFYYPSRTVVDWNTSPRDVDHAPNRLWDWSDPQLLRTFRNGPREPGFRERQ